MRSTLHTLVLAGLCSTGLLLSAQAQAQSVDAEAAQALAKKEGCLKCHALDKKKEAKSLTEISKSLKGKPNGEAKLLHHLTTTELVKLVDLLASSSRAVRVRNEVKEMKQS